MAAGITAYYDKNGSQTYDLVANQWPLREGEARPKEYGTSSSHIGVGVRCHATQSYRPPSKPAGTSKRMGNFYEKTGVSQHRTEPGFRDMKGQGTLTEVPLPGYGTIRRPLTLPRAGSAVLSDRCGMDDDTVSTASRRSRCTTGSCKTAATGSSTRSAGGASVQSRDVPWARTPTQPWDFETKPMYKRTNETYGSTQPFPCRPAGKSQPGFVDPETFIATFTRVPGGEC